MRAAFRLVLLATILVATTAPSPPRRVLRLGTPGEITRIDSPLHFSANTTIQLAGPLAIVRDGALRIDAGTRVEGALGAYIVITREGTVEASGTITRPIVLTCTASVKYPGCWGGVIVQGNARINAGPALSLVGGRSGTGGCRESVDPAAPALAYGGCNDADSSGVFQFVRIEYAERGLQLQGVGSGTVIHHVQANRSRFEGVLAIGGRARARELFLTANGTGLRWTGGWRGEAQAIAIQQDVASFRAALVGQNALTATGDPEALPRSAPTLFNLTILAQSTPVNPDHASARALVFERGTAGRVQNSFLYAPHMALDIVGAATCAQLNTGALALTSVVTAGASALGAGATPAECTSSEGAVLADAAAANVVVASAGGLLKSENDLLLPDLRPVFNSPLANATAATPPSGGILVGPAFVGAVPASVAPGQIPWFSGWTDPAPTPAPTPTGIVTGFVRSPFRGYLPNVTVRESNTGQSVVTSAGASYALSTPVGTVLLEVDNLPAECTAPIARAATVAPSVTTTVELIVDCWPFAAATRLAAGNGFVCAVAEQGPHCWGANGRGQLGIGTTSDTLLPAMVSGGFTSVTSGNAHACGRTSAADVRCWGAGNQGQVGDGAATDRLTPVPVSGGHSFLAVSAGNAHTCALKADGSVWCWGANTSGQLGTGSTATSAVPTQVVSSVLFASVDAGALQTCALDRAGAAYCWGSGLDGAIGDGSTLDRLTPVAVATPLRFTALSVAGAHACGTTTTHSVHCWGSNVNGALGDGTSSPRTSPSTVNTAMPLAFVSAGGGHSCAVSPNAIAQCWGANSQGQLGIGTNSRSLSPVAAPSATNMSLLSAGPDYSCGVTVGAVTGTGGNVVVVSARSLLCWGSNAGGQFGVGDRLSSTSPAGAAIGLTFR